MQNNTTSVISESVNKPDEELDLLDLLVTLAENWKLLLFTPIAAGLVALGISFALPKTYQSESSVQVERTGSSFSAPVAASLAMSADVLHTIAPVAGLDEGLTSEEIYKKLSKRIKVSVGKQDKLLNVVTEAKSPEAAQKLNQALLDTLFPFSKPRGIEKKQLEQQLGSEKKRLQEALKLEQDTGANIASGKSVTEATSRLYGELLSANSARQSAVLDMERRLGGLDNDDVVQAPTLPESSIKPKKSMIAIGATVATGFLLLLFVFARQALRSAQENSPEQAKKLSRIRQALPW
ncbi:MAG: lipopolysaccharide biosynthesis protein [Comamonas sp.]|jgi:capsular polysaccharide biosynthesis protein|uniref:Wzz/FepE/Etk N-terminal domain-containing protein n=1 Tax=Comamonas sp. TaxID=34028 RepID=UPI002830BB4D|nr:Wzz/FepE/Etk N-terminal domain-containing protein [Comamonas sp.]MDR0216264.1 lipopolysaccharide biosynthesis protein [Comamonas sp.]